MVLRDLEPFLLATFHSPFLFPDFTTLHIWGLPRELPESRNFVQGFLCLAERIVK